MKELPQQNFCFYVLSYVISEDGRGRPRFQEATTDKRRALDFFKKHKGDSYCSFSVVKYTATSETYCYKETDF